MSGTPCPRRLQLLPLQLLSHPFSGPATPSLPEACCPSASAVGSTGSSPLGSFECLCPACRVDLGFQGPHTSFSSLLETQVSRRGLPPKPPLAIFLTHTFLRAPSCQTLSVSSTGNRVLSPELRNWRRELTYQFSPLISHRTPKRAGFMRWQFRACFLGERREKLRGYGIVKGETNHRTHTHEGKRGAWE